MSGRKANRLLHSPARAASAASAPTRDRFEQHTDDVSLMAMQAAGAEPAGYRHQRWAAAGDVARGHSAAVCWARCFHGRLCNIVCLHARGKPHSSAALTSPLNKSLAGSLAQVWITSGQCQCPCTFAVLYYCKEHLCKADSDFLL